MNLHYLDKYKVKIKSPSTGRTINAYKFQIGDWPEVTIIGARNADRVFEARSKAPHGFKLPDDSMMVY